MPDFIVIGGGLIGMLTARALASEGWAVTLLEQGATGRESSWAGGGIISPLYPWRYTDAVTRLAGWSQQHYPKLAQALYEESGVDPEYRRNGLLVLDPGDIDTAQAWQEKTPQTVETLSCEGITECEPALTLPSDIEQAVWLPDVAQVRNPRLVKACRGAIDDRAAIQEQIGVTDLLTERGRIVGVNTTKGRHSAPNVIVCAGAWSGKLLQPFVASPKIEPVLGQMILFRADPETLQRIVLHEDRYLIPRRDGRILVGSTLEHTGFEKRTTHEARESLAAYARERFPVLREAEIEHHWAGLRPSSPQGIPFIGPVPEIEGLFVNAGHFRNGVVLGPASVQLLMDLICKRDPILPPEPYAVDAPRT
jgi:glycine oxidase